MASRQTLQTKLEEILGSENVYFNPPENLEMNYPAITYKINDVNKKSADNIGYFIMNEYMVTLIEYSSTSELYKKILELPGTSFDRSFKADNLNHTVLTINW